MRWRLRPRNQAETTAGNVAEIEPNRPEEQSLGLFALSPQHRSASTTRHHSWHHGCGGNFPSFRETLHSGVPAILAPATSLRADRSLELWVAFIRSCFQPAPADRSCAARRFEQCRVSIRRTDPDEANNTSTITMMSPINKPDCELWQAAKRFLSTTVRHSQIAVRCKKNDQESAQKRVQITRNRRL